jgi:hypothetical protein
MSTPNRSTKVATDTAATTTHAAAATVTATANTTSAAASAKAASPTARIATLVTPQPDTQNIYSRTIDNMISNISTPPSDDVVLLGAQYFHMLSPAAWEITYTIAMDLGPPVNYITMERCSQLIKTITHSKCLTAVKSLSIHQETLQATTLIFRIIQESKNDEWLVLSTMAKWRQELFAQSRTHQPLPPTAPRTPVSFYSNQVCHLLCQHNPTVHIYMHQSDNRTCCHLPDK